PRLRRSPPRPSPRHPPRRQNHRLLRRHLSRLRPPHGTLKHSFAYISQQLTGVAPKMSTYPPPASSLDPAFVTTALEIPGHRIVRNIGVVRGIVVRSRTLFPTIRAPPPPPAPRHITTPTD